MPLESTQSLAEMHLLSCCHGECANCYESTEEEVSCTYLPGKPTNTWLKDGFWRLSRSFTSRENMKAISNRENSPWNSLSHKRSLAYGQSTGFVRGMRGGMHCSFHAHTCVGLHTVWSAVFTPEIISPQILSWRAPLILWLSPQAAAPQRGLPWALANPILSHCPFAGFYFLLSACIMYMMYLIYILFVSSN